MLVIKVQWTRRVLQASPAGERTPVRIVALSSREEYLPFRLSPAAFGSFVHTRLYNDIVQQDIKPEHRPAAVHEYMDLLFRQAHSPASLAGGRLG